MILKSTPSQLDTLMMMWPTNGQLEGEGNHDDGDGGDDDDDGGDDDVDGGDSGDEGGGKGKGQS